jgi:hypothetical protein
LKRQAAKAAKETQRRKERKIMKMTDEKLILRFLSAFLSFMQGALCGMVVVALLWMAICSLVFRFRHPWATETEVILHLPDAVMWREVPYDEMRPRQ